MLLSDEDRELNELVRDAELDELELLDTGMLQSAHAPLMSVEFAVVINDW